MFPGLWRDVRPWDLLWEVLLYVLLAVSCLAVAGYGTGQWPQRWLTFAVAVAVAGWHWWMITAHPGWPGRLGIMSGYFAVLLGLLWLLVSREWLFLPVVVACCAMAFVALPGGWAYVGAALAGLVATAASHGIDPLGRLAMWAAWTAATVVCGAAFRFLEDQVQQRHAMVEQLRGANARLTELASQNAELARAAGALDERQRLAREIHDTLAQGLVAIVTQVEAAEEEAGHDPAAVRQRLAKVRTLARDSLTEARRSVHALRPGPLDNTALPDAVRQTAQRWSHLTGVPATVTVTGAPGHLHPEIEGTCLRVVQEALANVARHAAASRVGVTLTYLDDELLVDVRDDGAGFDASASPDGGRDPSTSSGGGFGLAAMRQRVTRLAGRLQVESAPGAGTALSVSLPAIREELP